ncbi:MAG: hypothetical protein PHU85_14805 [Phycisphaerae bacterium]|nr:hypothetical protein [Phycisphaerae bacterium]
MSSRKKVVLSSLAIALAVVAGAAFLFRPQIVRRYQAYQVERWLRAFETNRDKETGQKLAHLLDEQRVSEADGNRILAVLAEARVEVRKSYRVGTAPMVSVTPLSPGLGVNNLQVSYEPAQMFGNVNRGHTRFNDSRWIGGSGANIDWVNLRDKAPKPGKIDLVMSLRTKLKDRASQRVIYRYTQDVPVSFEMVPAGQEEKVQLVSSPELDERMRKCFSIKFDGTSGGGQFEYKCWSVQYTSLPENIGFRVIFRHEDGREVETWSTTRRTKNTWDCIPVFWPAVIKSAGKYRGHIILRSDLQAAQGDPGIKQIWGGQMEFPCEFDVTVTPGWNAATQAE